MKKITKFGIFGTIALAAIISFLGTYVQNLNFLSSYARGGSKIQTIQERIDYSVRDVDSYSLNPTVPGYDSGISCGPTAGGVAIAWYNKTLPNLIPGLGSPGTIFLNQWIWTTNGTPAIMSMFNQLAVDMDANSEGVTKQGYLDGLEIYVERCGYTFEYENTMGSNGMLNDKYKAALQNGKLLSIFMNGFNISNGLGVYSGYDTINMDEYSGMHIMTAYGYYEVEYMNAEGIIFRKDTYLLANSGLSGQLKWVRLNNYATILDCYIISIS